MSNINCEFCLLVSRCTNEDAKKIMVLETQNTIAFRRMNPNADVHIMVVPKMHVASVLDASDDLLLELMSTIKKVAADVTEKHGACRIMTNVGSYQDVRHLHWNITYNSGK